MEWIHSSWIKVYRDDSRDTNRLQTHREKLYRLYRRFFLFLKIFLVKHETDYVPVPRLEKRVEYIPVDRYDEHVDYVPV